MSKFQVTQLANGFKILSEYHSNTKAVSMCIGVHTGSREEILQENGITHLIEHLVFRGTKNRTALQITEEIEFLGGDLNAYTGRESTCYHAYLLAEDYKRGVEILSDIILNPSLKPEDIKKEKQVILHEIAMTEDDPEEQIFDDFYEHWYPKQSIGRPILGTKDSLKKINKKTISNFMKNHYRPDNMIFVCCGNVKHEDLVREVKKYFNKLKIKKKPPVKKASDLVSRKFIRHKKTKTEQSHMLFGFPSSSYSEGILYEAAIINSYLGYGSSSLLNQDLREKKPLCYSVYSHFFPLEEVGAYLIYIGTDSKNMEEATRIIWRRLKQIYKNGIPKEDLENLKKQWIRSLILQSEDLEGRMNAILQDSFLGRKYRSIATIKKGIEKIDNDSVKNFIKDYYHYKNISLLVFSNDKKEKVLKLGEIIS